MFQYPADDLDRPAKLAGVLGSFWSTTYAGADQVRAYAGALGRACRQTQDDLEEAAACLAPATTPAYHRERWRLAYSLRSTLTARAAPLRHGDGAVFGAGANYGDAATRAAYPSGIAGYAEVPIICNRLTDPSRVLLVGVDYVLDRGEVVFRDDIAADPAWARRPIFDPDGAVVDEEVALWLFRPGLDRDHVRLHGGYLVGLPLPASPANRDLVAAALAALRAGGAAAATGRLLAAATGVPTVAEDGEVVAVVGSDARGPCVVTDRRAYRLPPGSRPVVVAGQVLVAGDDLCDAVRVVDLGRGATSGLPPALALGPGLLASGLGEIVVEDRTVPLTVDAEGQARFEIHGHPADVAAFWAAVDARGVASGQTLAAAIGIPQPATINPLRFLADEVLRAGIVVRVRAAIAPRALSVLPRILPVHVPVLFVVEPPARMDPIADPAGGESASTHMAASPIMDAVADPSADGPHRVQIASRTCR
jgi:hypothetical protein